jgi:hypothetical protein
LNDHAAKCREETVGEETKDLLEQVARPDLIHRRLCEITVERRILQRMLKLTLEARDEVETREQESADAAATK